MYSRNSFSRAGQALLRQAAPVMGLVLLMVVAGSAVLFLWISRVARELSANEAELSASASPTAINARR